MQIWKPISDLPDKWQDMAHEELASLADVWKEQKEKLADTQSYQKFLDKMRRKIAIETGVIERLYNIDRGTTQLLIEHGIDEAIIQHDSTDKPRAQVVALIRDQEQAIEGLFDFVANQRDLSTSYIKQLHQFLTRHQEYTEAMDQYGNIGKVELIRGDWKKAPNNPQRNGEIFYYCSPEQVASEMDRLVTLYLEHNQKGVNPDINAAWLHHRFTQIHPFQDGNGRVARVLASLVFIRADWFPLVVTRDDRTAYIAALEDADTGNLQSLVDLFAKAQKQAFLGILSLSEEVLEEGKTFSAILDAAVTKIQKKRETQFAEAKHLVQAHAGDLFVIAERRFEEVVQQLQSALENVVKDPALYIKKAHPDQDSTNGYYRYQIIQVAKKHDYYAYLEGYKSWLALAIELERGLRTEIILSFHEVGYDQKGVMVCSAIGSRIIKSDEEQSNIEDVQALSQAPFEFTYLENKQKLEKRFQEWLESAVNVGMEYWRRNI